MAGGVHRVEEIGGVAVGFEIGGLYICTPVWGAASVKIIWLRFPGIAN